MPLVEGTGDLFKNAPNNAILTHACNAQGRWGRGIAVTFRNDYPFAYKAYQEACKNIEVGDAKIFNDTKGVVGCLITSRHYNPPDFPTCIMHNTKEASKRIIQLAKTFYPGYEIHSNRFNSGLFEVPWSMTYSALAEAIEESGTDILWKVWVWK